jgi:hypothetical protein
MIIPMARMNRFSIVMDPGKVISIELSVMKKIPVIKYTIILNVFAALSLMEKL